MPYTTNAIKAKYEPSNELPTKLAHKPVYAMPYEKFDGIYVGNTDVRYISVGISQWSPYEVSVKTMRFVNGKWTRQAEELPLHRAIDATIFLAKVIFDKRNGQVDISPNTFFRQAGSIRITAEERTNGEMASYFSFLNQHADLLRERLGSLLDILDSLREAGEI